MANLFETAGVVKNICRKTRTGMFREFWTEELKASLLEIFHLNESEQTLELLNVVKEKINGFLSQVKNRLSQMQASYQEKREFYSHLVNSVFAQLGAGIEGPSLAGPITRVRTQFPRDYSKGDRDQSALIKRQYDKLKGMYTQQGNPDPHTAAVDQIRKDWQGVSDNLIRNLGKQPKPKPVIAPEVKPIQPETQDLPKEDSKDPPLGKHKMTLAEMIADAKEHFDEIKKTVHSKDAQKKSIRRYLGNKHFNSALSRNPIIDNIVDKIFGTDRLKGKDDEEKDEKLAKHYVSVESAAKTAETGAKKPSVKHIVNNIDDLIQSAAWQNRGYLRMIISPYDRDPEGLLALCRERLREMGCTVGETVKEETKQGHPETYKIYFEKPK